LTGDTLVETINGAVAIRKLVGTIGLLYSMKNEKCTVADFYNVRCTQKNQQIYKVELENSINLCATGGHKVFSEIGWKEIQNLNSGEMLYVIDGLLSRDQIQQRQNDRILSFKQSDKGQAIPPSPICLQDGEGGNTGELCDTSSGLEQGQQSYRQSGLYPGESTPSNPHGAINAETDKRNTGDAKDWLPKGESMAYNDTRAQMAPATWKAGSAEHADDCQNVHCMWEDIQNQVESNETVKVLSSELQRIRQTAKVKILRVTPLDRYEDVYCLTVPETGCFAVNGGLIVANCKDSERYVLQTIFGQDTLDLNLLTRM
jgi:hypothetical protein